MSKGLSQMNNKERSEAVARRLREQKEGLGYWAAVDAKAKQEAKSETSS